MSCEAEREFLVDHLAGELDEDGAVRLEQHLAECASCRAEAQALQRIVASNAPADAWTPDPSMAKHLYRRAAKVRGENLTSAREQEPAPSLPGFHWAFRPLPSFAAVGLAMIALIAGLWIGGARREGMSARTTAPLLPAADLPAPATTVNPAPAIPVPPARSHDKPQLAVALQTGSAAEWVPGFVVVECDAIRAESISRGDSF